MLVSNSRFENISIMSLHTGSELAKTTKPLIDPRHMSIVAYELHGPLVDEANLIRIDDIREIGPLGMIINSSDELISPSDVIKIKEIYELEFDLIGVKVVSDSKRRIGKVVGYTIDTNSFTIQQLKVQRPFFQSFGDTELLIHRSQIVGITNSVITVKDAKIRHKGTVSQSTESFENPFRKKQPQPQIEGSETN